MNKSLVRDCGSPHCFDCRVHSTPISCHPMFSMVPIVDYVVINELFWF